MKTQLSPQDWQQLSAYLDGQLSTTEKERLETRLRSQTSLRSGLEEINQTRTILRSVPKRKVPHNFILTRAMVAEQTRRRSAWFPVLSLTSLVSLVLLVVVSLFYQLQAGAAPSAAPVAMQAARSDQPGAAQATSQPMIIQWGNGGSGGGDGGAVPQSAIPQGLGMGGGGGPTPLPENNNLMKSQAITPSAGIEAAPAPTELPAATSEPAIAAPAAPALPETLAPTELPAENNTPTAGAAVQPKLAPNQAEGPVNIYGIAPTQEQGKIQSTAPVTNNYQAPAQPVNLLPFIQVGLIVLTVTAAILAFLLRKKS